MYLRNTAAKGQLLAHRVVLLGEILRTGKGQSCQSSLTVSGEKAEEPNLATGRPLLLVRRASKIRKHPFCRKPPVGDLQEKGKEVSTSQTHICYVEYEYEHQIIFQKWEKRISWIPEQSHIQFTTKAERKITVHTPFPCKSLLGSTP